MNYLKQYLPSDISNYIISEYLMMNRTLVVDHHKKLMSEIEYFYNFLHKFTPMWVSINKKATPKGNIEAYIKYLKRVKQNTFPHTEIGWRYY